MNINIIKPGLLTTVQDNGRGKYLAHGVPRSGVLDNFSARLANIAVGNNDNAATLEFTYANAAFKIETDALIAYAGDGAFLTSEGSILPAERPIFVPSGSVIQLKANPVGVTTYLAIAGGLDLPEILESRSTYLPGNFGGMNGRSLKAGDSLYNLKHISSLSQKILNKLKGKKVSWPLWHMPRACFLPADKKVIRIFPAGEFNWFTEESTINLFSTPFLIGLNSNRMGYRLTGNKIIRRKSVELLSTAVCPGTIQVTGSGEPILLMADCQTTGGYPRIGQVISVDLPLCAQLKPNDSIRFTEISKEAAEILYIKREKILSDLKLAVESRF